MGLRWDVDAANRAIGFFEEALHLSAGEFEGKPFRLEPWQAFIVGSLFGWKGADGYRRFRVAYSEIGKGNGKSPLAAGVGLYMETADSEPRAEVYAAAADKDQAAVIFRTAVSMVGQSPVLDAAIERSGGPGREWNLAFPRSDPTSFFRPISSESRGRGKSGPLPHCALLDEIHEHPTNAMVEFMRAGTKSRRQALIFMITNSGVDRESVCFHYHEYAAKVLSGAIEDDSFFAYVCGLDPCEACRAEGFTQPKDGCEDCDDWRDEAVWPKANPNLDVSIPRKYLQEQVREATGMPSKQSIVKRLNFCLWVGAENPWISEEAWMACLADLDWNDYRGRRAVCGLDLSFKLDLTANAWAFPPLEPGGTIDVFVDYWTPLDTLRAREERDRAPYWLWKEQGFLTAVPGTSLDYAFIAGHLKQRLGEVTVDELAYDRTFIDNLLTELDRAGVDAWICRNEADAGTGLKMVPFGQGYLSMAPAVNTLEEMVVNRRVRIHRNPVTTWCSSNAVVQLDDAGNRKFSKRKSTGRIDGLVAVVMAVHRAQFYVGEEPSIYEVLAREKAANVHPL